MKHKLLALALFFLVIVGSSVRICAQADDHLKSQEESLILRGKLHTYMDVNSTRWLQVADFLNPAMLGEFANREHAGPQVPWFGEFPGKLLTSIAYSYKMQKSQELLEAGNRIVDKLAGVQATDGYLGSFKYNDRFSGILGTGTWKNWDLWNHYHNILGLYRWYQQTGNKKCMEIAVKTSDYLVSVFKDRTYSDASETQMNLAISHAFMLLYNEASLLDYTTPLQKKNYYDDAKRIVDQEWTLPTAGNWYHAALSNTDFYQTSMHRWEVLHCIMTLAEFYKADQVKNKKYFKAFEQIYWSILKTDIHNNGSFSTGEGACGNPYIAGNKEPAYSGSIETCCTIAWAELAALYLELVQDSYLADELERTTLNGALSTLLLVANQPVYTYDTPMNGTREPAIQTLNWQGVKGAPDVSCCQLNGPKSPGLIGQWGVVKANNQIYLNYYGESTIQIKTVSGSTLTLVQETDYPISGNIKMRIGLASPEKIALNLRIPFWSESTELKVNGVAQKKVSPRSYYELNREFKEGDLIELSLDMSPHFWAGEDKFTGYASIYWGPIMMAQDEAVSEKKPDLGNEFELNSILNMVVKESKKPHVWMEADVSTLDGTTVSLCDFMSAGHVPGKVYHSWFKVAGIPVVKFSKEGTPVWGSTVLQSKK